MMAQVKKILRTYLKRRLTSTHCEIGGGCVKSAFEFGAKHVMFWSLPQRYIPVAIVIAIEEMSHMKKEMVSGLTSLPLSTLALALSICSAFIIVLRLYA